MLPPDLDLGKSDRAAPELSRQLHSSPFLASRALILALLVAATYLPFINQAVHIDDPIYLEVADTILKKPLYPYDFPVIFEGYQAPDAASHSHLPLTSYYLALIKLVTGGSQEWAMHLGFMIFPLLAAWAMYDVGRHFVRWPLAVAGLLVVSPAFMTLSHTLMTDVPLLTFWLVAFSGFFRVFENPDSRRGWLILAAGLCAAALISLMSIIQVALFATAALLAPRLRNSPYRLRLLGVLAAPLVIWAAWFVLAYVHYGRFVLVLTYLHLSSRQAPDWSLVGVRALSFVLNLGALFMMPLVAWFVFGAAVRTRVALLGFLAAAVPFFWMRDWTWLQVFLFALFLSTGALMLAGVLWPPGDRLKRLSTDSLPSGLLTVWFIAFLLVCVFVYYNGSVRYTLTVLPSVLTVGAVCLERRVASERKRRGLLVVALAVTAVYSLWLSHADYVFAGVYRNAARELATQYRAPGRTIWVAGEWGFRYYMNREGARTMLKTTTVAKPGDIIVKPYVAMPWVTAYDGNQYADLLEKRQARIAPGLRLLDFRSHAGFYSTGWGILPFSLSESRRWEWFIVYRVKKEYKGPPPSENRPY